MMAAIRRILGLDDLYRRLQAAENDNIAAGASLGRAAERNVQENDYATRVVGLMLREMDRNRHARQHPHP